MNIIYENPIPQLRSRQAAFSNICQLADGTLLAAMKIGEAFESADGASYLCRSTDGGKTWSAPKRMFDPNQLGRPCSGSCKITALPDGRLAAIGYVFFRDNPDMPLGNPETGGLLEDYVFCSYSEDQGETWSPMEEIKCAWGPHVEASAPLYVLQDGSLITPITGFPCWDGSVTGPRVGRALRSFDLGKTWSAPISTGIQGQASAVCAIGGEMLLAVHAIRRDTDRPGIYGYKVDYSDRIWKIVDEALLWEPAVPMFKDSKMAEIFSFLKFGQPMVVKLADGSLLLSFWYAQEGQYKTVCMPIEL